jgi:hypothetical protein
MRKLPETNNSLGCHNNGDIDNKVLQDLSQIRHVIGLYLRLLRIILEYL